MLGSVQIAPGAYSVPGVVLVVDDDRWIRRAVKRLLQTEGMNVETFASGHQMFSRGLPEQPCCVVLDLRMPEVDGLEVLDILGRTERRPPVIFMTAQGDVASTVAAMKAGAIEFLEKPFEDADLLTAIEDALGKDRLWLNRRAHLHRAQLRLALLTPRELEILPYVVEGLSNKVTAANLGITEKTVKVHRARVFEKTGTDSLPGLVRFAAVLGIYGIGRTILPSSGDQSSRRDEALQCSERAICNE